MNINTFESYWREFGKLEHEVIKNPRELEEDFRKFGEKIWNDIEGSSQSRYDEGHSDGYDCGEDDTKNRIYDDLDMKGLLTEEIANIIEKK